MSVETTGLIDQAARERIAAEVDRNLCVEAGAGTGKTTILLRRIVKLLRSGEAEIGELAVITFTDKAAGELSTRLRFDLEEAAAGAADPDERERLERALAGMHRARVQTIHAFAADILRERPVEARLDPQFELMEDLAAELHFDAAYREFLDELLDEHADAVALAMRRGFSLRNLRKLAEHVHGKRHVLPVRAWAFEAPPARSIQPWAAEAAAELDRLAPHCTAPEDDKGFAQLEDARDYLAHVGSLEDEETLERLLLFETPNLKQLGNKSNWDPEESCGRMKELYGEVSTRIAELADGLRTEVLLGLLPHVERFVADYAAQRRRDAVLDFDDLLIWARDLVREERTVRAHFHRRTTRVLVDEFQDTDPIQAELVTWICGPPEADGDWRSVEPLPGRLFVVGDPKQAIYRFRGADIAAYDDVKNGPLDGELEGLEQNFRSTGSLLGWVNDLFDEAFGDGERGVQPANTKLHPAPGVAEPGRSSVVVVRSDEKWAEESGSSEAMRAEESSLIARTLARAVRDERWRVRDKATDEVRDATWRDVAILVPARTHIELLEAALGRYGVPFRIEGNVGFFERQEVRDLVSILAAIDDPTDQIAIVAALRSLAFGCSDEELLDWRLAHGRFDYRHVPEEGGPDCVREAFLVLRDLNDLQRRRSLGEFVRTVVERTGLVEAALTLPGGEQPAANVLKVVQRAQAFASASGGALRGFTKWLEGMRDEDEGEPEAPVAEERDDVVRVMTIHAAKGLEFPIVALANTEWGGGGDIPVVPDPAEERMHLKLGGKPARFMTPGYDKAVEREKAALEAERLRLLYVALTRARDHLVLPVCRPEPTKGFVGVMRGRLDGGFGIEGSALEAVAAVAAEDGSLEVGAADAALIAAREEFSRARDAAVADAEARGIELDVASTAEPDRPLAAEAAADAAAGADDPGVIDTEGAPPLSVGVTFHRVMELVDLPDASTLEPLAESICLEHGIPEHTEAIVSMARLALRTLDAMDGAGDWHREVPFVVPDEGRVLVGRIDLLVDADPAVILDYKTDEDVDLAAARKRHGAQLQVYDEAGTIGLRGRSVNVRLLLTRTGAVG